MGLAILSGIFAASVKTATMHGSNAAAAQIAGYHDAFFIASFFTLAASIIAALGVNHVKAERVDPEPIIIA